MVSTLLLLVAAAQNSNDLQIARRIPKRSGKPRYTMLVQTAIEGRGWWNPDDHYIEVTALVSWQNVPKMQRGAVIFYREQLYKVKPNRYRWVRETSIPIRVEQGHGMKWRYYKTTTTGPIRDRYRADLVVGGKVVASDVRDVAAEDYITTTEP